MRDLMCGIAGRLNYLKRVKTRAVWGKWVHCNIRHRSIYQHPRYWYADTPQFRDERFCDVVSRRITHTGWFGDTENGENLHRGIVGRLPHGRFVAGYFIVENPERIYYPDVFDDEVDAAIAADEHARVAAEIEDEYSKRCNESYRLEQLIEAKIEDVRDCKQRLEMLILAMRADGCSLGARLRATNQRKTIRREVNEIINDIRALRRDHKALDLY